MAQYRVIAEVKDSRCPFVSVGDRMVVEGTMLNLAETTSVCTVALSSIQYSLFMMGKADDPRDFGRELLIHAGARDGVAPAKERCTWPGPTPRSTQI